MDSTSSGSDFARRVREEQSDQDASIATPSASAAPRSQPPTTAAKPKAAPKASTKDHFNEGLVPAQFKLPRDLVASLKLHSIASGKSMSDIVLDCLTSDELIAKAWISTKRAA